MHQGRIAFGAQQVPADAAQAYRRVMDGLDVGSVHRIVVPAVRARIDGIVPVGIAVLFDGEQKGVLYPVREKFPHSQETARYCLSHMFNTPSGLRYGWYCSTEDRRGQWHCMLVADRVS